MDTREIEAKARLLFDEYGPEANVVASRRTGALAQGGGAQADDWRAVQRRVDELTRQEIAAEAAEIEADIKSGVMRPNRGSRLARLSAAMFGSARKPA